MKIKIMITEKRGTIVDLGGPRWHRHTCIHSRIPWLGKKGCS
jgi:hypothetical protein